MRSSRDFRLLHEIILLLNLTKYWSAGIIRMKLKSESERSLSALTQQGRILFQPRTKAILSRQKKMGAHS